MPISLQYGPYTAEFPRDRSIAGDPRKKDVLNRIYRGKRVVAHNVSDLKMGVDTRKAMKNKPIIVTLELSFLTVVAEFEKEI